MTFAQSHMSSDAIKKRKSKVLRNEGGTPEMKRGRGEGEQQVTDTGSKDWLMGPEVSSRKTGTSFLKICLPENFIPKH